MSGTEDFDDEPQLHEYWYWAFYHLDNYQAMFGDQVNTALSAAIYKAFVNK